MSNYTWPQKCPDLVQDVSLKRARVDDENNTSAIRTTISGVDADHPLPVSISAISENVDQPLPVLVKSDKTRWFLRGEMNSSFVYYSIKWFYLSPQFLPYNSNNSYDNKWFTVIKMSSTNGPGVGPADLTQPPVYSYNIYESGSFFMGGWVASRPQIIYSNASYSLVAFKAGNTDFSSPDLEVSNNSKFLWDGEDFMNCQQHFDSTALYLQQTQGLPYDAPWSGTGNGTVISLLKGIANIF